MVTRAALNGRLVRLTFMLPSGSFSDTDPAANALVLGGSEQPAEAGQRIVAKAVKTRQKEPNAIEVTVYNLAPATRANLQTKGLRLLLEAGYKGTGIQTVCVGDVRTVDHVRDGPDWKTILKAGDGERAFRYARASKSFAAGVTVGQVVDYCAGAMGLSLGNTGAQAGALTQVIQQGYTVHGSSSTELHRILRSVGYDFSIQNGHIQILAPNEWVSQTIPIVSAETGMIGSPEMGSPEKSGKPPLCKFKSLLMPASVAGGRVQLISERYNGIFGIQKATDTLDTHGAEWFTEIEGVQDNTAVAV